MSCWRHIWVFLLPFSNPCMHEAWGWSEPSSSTWLQGEAPSPSPQTPGGVSYRPSASILKLKRCSSPMSFCKLS